MIFRIARAAVALALSAAIGISPVSSAAVAGSQDADFLQTTTPIKHLVVIFQENVSFDHYFGTYPEAANTAGEPQFHAAPDTPTVNGLTAGLLTNNPNLNGANTNVKTNSIPS
ncbi:MAG TPA: alkaline phosphatase family protein, partial [Candidatus Acidoferrum sp.]|nr:alkaline phosphatase family protein [Candidatus Acidoferrum sp.]